jgi:hypothetical protein
MCKLKVLSPLELLERGVSFALSLVPFLLFYMAFHRSSLESEDCEKRGSKDSLET